jgi:hypothetical protein
VPLVSRYCVNGIGALQHSSKSFKNLFSHKVRPGPQPSKSPVGKFMTGQVTRRISVRRRRAFLTELTEATIDAQVLLLLGLTIDSPSLQRTALILLVHTSPSGTPTCAACPRTLCQPPPTFWSLHSSSIFTRSRGIPTCSAAEGTSPGFNFHCICSFRLCTNPSEVPGLAIKLVYRQVPFLHHPRSHTPRSVVWTLTLFLRTLLR